MGAGLAMTDKQNLTQLQSRQWSCETLQRGISYMNEQSAVVKEEVTDLQDRIKVPWLIFQDFISTKDSNILQPYKPCNTPQYMPHILKRNLVSAKAAQQVRAELLKKLEANEKETKQLKHDDGTVQDLQDLDDGTRTELDGEECEEESEEEKDRMDEGQTGKKVLENEVLNPELWPDNQVGLYGWGDEQETQVPRPVTTPVRCQTEFEVKGTKAPTMSGDECPEIPFTQPDPEIIDDEVPTMDDAYQLNEVALDEVTDDRSLEES